LRIHSFLFVHPQIRRWRQKCLGRCCMIGWIRHFLEQLIPKFAELYPYPGRGELDVWASPFIMFTSGCYIVKRFLVSSSRCCAVNILLLLLQDNSWLRLLAYLASLSIFATSLEIREDLHRNLMCQNRNSYISVWVKKSVITIKSYIWITDASTCFQLFNYLQTCETKRVNIEQIPYKPEYKTAPNKRWLPLFFTGVFREQTEQI